MNKQVVLRIAVIYKIIKNILSTCDNFPMPEINKTYYSNKMLLYFISNANLNVGYVMLTQLLQKYNDITFYFQYKIQTPYKSTARENLNLYKSHFNITKT